MVWTVLAHLDDLALDEERAARHALDDAQVDDEDVARDDPAVEGIVLHDGRERMVFAERNADSAAFEHPGGVDEHGEGHDGVGELPHEHGALERRAARSYELEGPVLREAQNGVESEAATREQAAPHSSSRKPIQAPPETARRLSPAVTSKPPIAGLNAKAASVPPSSHFLRARISTRQSARRPAGQGTGSTTPSAKQAIWFSNVRQT